MTRKLMVIEVRGRYRQWGFLFYGDPAHISDWRADGLDVAQVENIVPDWVPWWLVRAWCWGQDVFNFKWGRG